jgi:hypothetical protein
LREHQWTPIDRALLISAIAVAMAALFLTTYSLALGAPVPRGIDAALIGNRAANVRTVHSVERVANGKLDFRQFASVRDALDAIDRQEIYAALDLTAKRPTLYIASAAGASVARVLERVAFVDPTVRVVDTHPLDAGDPSGIDIFYLMLVATIVGFLTVFQVRTNAAGLRLRHSTIFVVGLAVVASFVLAVLEGPLLGRLNVPVPETWGILALHILAVASFAWVMSVLLGRWAILPTWLFFIVLGNTSSGGAVAPPLLPSPFAFVSQWLPSGATVTSLRDAIYFHDHQHARPLAVLATWAVALFTAKIVVSSFWLRTQQRDTADARDYEAGTLSGVLFEDSDSTAVSRS